MAIARQDFNIYRGDDWSHLFVVMDIDGLYATDAQITNGNATLTLPGGGATDALVGKKIALVNGSGIADGVTVSSVAPNGKSLVMSANASATRTKVRVAISPMDLTGFTLNAQVRQTADATGKITDINIDEARKNLGILRFYLPNATTKTLGIGGVWDMQIISPGGIVSTIAGGLVGITHDVTRIP